MKKRKEDRVYGLKALKKLGGGCKGKMHQVERVKRKDSVLMKQRARYVYGLEEEAP